MTRPRLDEARILAVLGAYVSSGTASGIVRSVASYLKTSASELDGADPTALIDAIASSVGPFVSQTQRAALKAQLESQTEPQAPTTAKFPIRGDLSVSQSRLAAREMCRTAGATSAVAQQVATCVSELARNILQYAGDGEIELSVHRAPRRGIVVRATDRGPGIPHIEQIYAGEYRSKTGQGRGILGIRRVASKFNLVTDASGTLVEFESWF